MILTNHLLNAVAADPVQGGDGEGIAAELGLGVHAGQPVDGGAGGADIAVDQGFCPCPIIRGFWYRVDPAQNPWFGAL